MNAPTQTSSSFVVENWPGLILGLFTLAGVGLIGLGQSGTDEAIAERRAEDLQRSLEQVIPNEFHDNNLLEGLTILDISGVPTTTYQGTMGGRVSAVAFAVTATDGYGGPMEILLGIDVKGRLLGVRVLSHTETPGLGDKIEASKSDWIKGFNGKGLDNLNESDWAVKKDGGQFDAFSGATITPRAVVKAVHKALRAFKKQRTDLAVAPQTQKKDSHP